MLLLGLVWLSPEGDALHDVVIFVDPLDPAPEVEGVVLVLLGELRDCQFELDAFLGAEGLPDFIDEPEL